jgi:threonyl-tRNA synthetase
METIIITLPDGTKKTCNPGITPGEIAQSIGEGLFRASIAGKVNGIETDLNSPIIEDSNIEIITKTSQEAHEILLHSTAHLLAQAVKELYPSAKIAIGPAIDARKRPSPIL